MAITVRKPNTIHLGGDMTMVGDIAAGEVITPGALVHRSAGTFLNHPDAAGLAQPAFALEQAMMNAGQDQDPHVEAIDFDYASGDLMMVGVGKPGSTFLALLASGENASDGDFLNSVGDGELQVSDTLAVVAAIEAVDNSNGDAPRIRVEVL